MMTRSVDDLIKHGQLRIEEKARVDLVAGQQLSLVRVEMAAGVVEPAHTHPGIEVLYGLTGHGFVELDRTRRIPLAAGQALVVEPGRVKALGNDGAEPLAVLAVLALPEGQPPFTAA